MKRLLVLCGLVALLVAPAALASNSQPLAFFTSHANLSPNVSQQSGVANPTLFGNGECVWDANDYMQRDAVLNSALDSGASASDSLCVYADWAAHAVTSEIAANSPNMILTITFSSGGSYTVVPTFDKRLGLWMYRTCVNVPTYQLGDPLLQSVANSNGGVAVPTTVTLSASNPSSKQVAKIRYDWGVFAGTC